MWYSMNCWEDNMKRKFANKGKDILDSVYKSIEVKTDKFNGNISLLQIKKVKKNWIVPRENGTGDCILAPGHQWLQIYPNDKHYAITAMYDKENRIVEWYFDVIKEAGVIDKIPYIDDLYLDVVLTKTHDIIVLDEDELEEALKIQDITEAEYNLAQKMGKEIIDNLKKKEQVNLLKSFSDQYLKILQNQ